MSYPDFGQGFFDSSAYGGYGSYGAAYGSTYQQPTGATPGYQQPASFQTPGFQQPATAKPASTVTGVGDFSANTHASDFDYGWASNNNAASAAMSQNLRTARGARNFVRARGTRGRGYGAPRGQMPNDRTGIGFGNSTWVAPPSAAGGTFPSKKRPHAGLGFGPKPTDTTGKTPSMLIHELFRDIVEKYEEVGQMPTKRYRCILTIASQEFAMEANSKKAAKQFAAQLALKSLRPELDVMSFDEKVAVIPQKKEPKAEALDESSDTSSNPYHIPPTKKSKGDAIDDAASLLDCLRRLCLERRTPEGAIYNPEFAFVETTPQEQPDAQKRRTIFKTYKCSLSFTNAGKFYEGTGNGKPLAKECVIRNALRELFSVSDKQIRTIVRRHIMGKLKEQSVMSTLYQVAKLCNCDLSFTVENGADSPIGMPNPKFVATCRLVDHSCDDKEVTFTSAPSRSKAEAREYAAHELLRTYFEIDPQTVAETSPANAVLQTQDAPVQKLQILMSRYMKGTKYEYTEPVGNGAEKHVSYTVTLKVGDRTFEGTAASKKGAKNDASVKAIEDLFPGNHGMPALCSEECKQICATTLNEYASMCKYYHVRPSNNICAFYLVNEEGKTRIVALGAAFGNIVSKEKITESGVGNTIVHMDPIVLARRALIRNLLGEVAKAQRGEESVLERAEDGMWQLNNNFRLVMYATYAPPFEHASPDAPLKSLAIIGKQRLIAVQVLDTATDVSEEFPKVHCTADKIYKWSQLGVQGALLSSLIHPIRPSAIYIGSELPNVPDAHLEHAFFSRVHPAVGPSIVEVKRDHVPIMQARPHVWGRDFDTLETLDGMTGRTAKGVPSRVSKSAFLEEYLKLCPDVSKDITYAEAKAKSVTYNKAKTILYTMWEEAGLGKWQSQPEELRSFSLPSSD